MRAARSAAACWLPPRCSAVVAASWEGAGTVTSGAEVGGPGNWARALRPMRPFSVVPGLAALAQPSEPGMFGIEGLQAPPDFAVLCQDAIRTCQALAETVASLPPSPAVVDAVDEISDTLCRVLDPAELCRQAAVSAEWRAAALQVCIDMEGYVQALNTDTRLYRALSATVEAGDRVGPPFWQCREQEVVARALLRDFHLGGIHLDSRGTAHVTQIKQQVQMLEMDFQHALSDKSQLGALDLTRLRAGQGTYPHGKVYPLDTTQLSTLLFHAEEEEVRRRAYLEGNVAPANNLVRLESIIHLRHRLATLTGFRSFAAYTIQPYSLAQKPEPVVSFLREMATELRPLVGEELRVLQRLKGAGRGRLRHWDRLHLMAKARSKLAKTPHASITDYLPMEACLAGLAHVLDGTMGLRLDERPLGAAESWAPGVRKFVVAQPGGEEYGTIYLDMIRRAGKTPNAAHFNIRSGRRLGDTGRYQSPVVALVCNFGAGGCLTLRDLETLFHEFGHALHSMLSRTRYQHLAGIRGAMDSMEVPSHLWQHFASDPRILRAIGAHHATGAPIPEEMLANVQQSHDMFAASELQQLVMYSLMDQAYASSDPPPPGESTAALAALYEEHTDLPLEPGTHPQIRFGHLVGYGANYYSYLYAQSIASSLWERYFAEDPLNRDAGEVIHRGLLRLGGTLTGDGQLRELLGDGAARSQADGGWAPPPDTLLGRLRARPCMAQL